MVVRPPYDNPGNGGSGLVVVKYKTLQPPTLSISASDGDVTLDWEI